MSDAPLDSRDFQKCVARRHRATVVRWRRSTHLKTMPIDQAARKTGHENRQTATASWPCCLGVVIIRFSKTSGHALAEKQIQRGADADGGLLEQRI